ncbi:MAG: hypothetical protein ABF289_20570 [Clostridiales bacterium]
MTTSDTPPTISIPSPAIITPFPGAVCPAIVIYESSSFIGLPSFSLIMPETSKMTILGPLASTASLKLPLPESFKLVTW